ncbi:MAG: DUF2017 family protein, partial [Pseudonocardiaceae bacterium]
PLPYGTDVSGDDTALQPSTAEYVIDMSSAESDAMRQTFTQLLTLMDRGSARIDPALRRLFPDGYREDRAAADELRRFTEATLRDGKQESSRQVLTDLPKGEGRVRLSFDRAELWLTALTDARLVLGSRLNITAETDVIALLDAQSQEPAPESEAATFLLAIYQHLTFLQESLLRAITSSDDHLDHP